MSDEEIITASVNNANKKAEQSKAARVLQKGPLMFIAATSIVAGALAKGGLSNKAVEGIKTLGTLALASSLIGPVDKGVRAVMDSTSKEGETKASDKHPIVNLVADAAVLTGTTCLAIAGLRFGKDKLASKFAPTANALKDSFTKKATKLDTSKAGKFVDKISNQASQFASTHPKLANAARNLAQALPGVAFISGSVCGVNKVIDERNDIATSNINKLLLCREFAKAALDKE